jgi:hypothetical protein
MFISDYLVRVGPHILSGDPAVVHGTVWSCCTPLWVRALDAIRLGQWSNNMSSMAVTETESGQGAVKGSMHAKHKNIIHDYPIYIYEIVVTKMDQKTIAPSSCRRAR